MGRSNVFYNALIKLWPTGKAIHWLGNRPLVGPLLRPFFGALDAEAIILPVHEAVQGGESVVLPYPLLTEILGRASVRFLMNDCFCRSGENCQTYPHDLGCLFLGEGAAEINPTQGRLVDTEEALAHVRRAMNLGLVPLIVHSRFDAWSLGVPFRRMLGICFCCDCCCAVRHGLRLGPPVFWDMVSRLPGLTVEVEETCVSCSACADVCYVKAVTMNNGRAHISLEQCKGCGRCIAVCPTGAIGLRMDESVDALAQILARIELRTDIGQT